VSQLSSDRAEYLRRVAAVHAAYEAIPAGQPVRLRKRTSNLFRPRAQAPANLDVTPFEGVLEVDRAARTADVLGMTTYRDLVDATLPYGLMPLVVPQLKTITLGGAVTGMGIESSSFRVGGPHESVLEMDVLTGAGEVFTATPTNDYADLFHAFPNSYGSLGYALRLKIELAPVEPYVHLRNLRFADSSTCAAAIATIVGTGEHGGQRVDFVDGVWFGAAESYLVLGTFSRTAPATSDYTGAGIYYRSIQERREDWLTVLDYLWRWDTDWFWCSRAFGAQHPVLRRVWPRRWRRSDVYWKLVALNRRTGFSRWRDRRHGVAGREDIVQDIEVPVDRAAEFLAFLDAETGIEPVWLCPLRQRDPTARWDLYVLDPDTTYVNIGFWSSVEIGAAESDGVHNRAIEKKVAELNGRKSLYSTAFYSPEEFWQTYGGASYDKVKASYDPDGRLLSLYDKTVRRR
jgi:FAD/FMN-containing dehydrogenase